MNETLFNEMQGKQEISHLTELKYFRNIKLYFSPPSLKDHFLQAPNFVAFIQKSDFTVFTK